MTRSGERDRGVRRQARLDAPAAEVLRDRDGALVPAGLEREPDGVPPADRAEEAVVARAVPVVAAVEGASAEVDDGAVAEADVERERLCGRRDERRAREHGVASVAKRVHPREVGEAGG